MKAKSRDVAFKKNIAFTKYFDNHFEKIQKLQQKLIKKYDNCCYKISQFKWQKSFHDNIIRDEKDFENYFNYTINNFLKHDLPKIWKYTSLNFLELYLKNLKNRIFIFLSPRGARAEKKDLSEN